MHAVHSDDGDLQVQGSAQGFFAILVSSRVLHNLQNSYTYLFIILRYDEQLHVM